MNWKRVRRLCQEEGLAVQRGGRRRYVQAPGIVRAPLTGPNERWGMDFGADTPSSGRRLRCRIILDEFNRKSLWIRVDHSIPASGVIEGLETLCAERSLPETLAMDVPKQQSRDTRPHFDARSERPLPPTSTLASAPTGPGSVPGSVGAVARGRPR